MAKKKEQPIPADLLAMTIDELYAADGEDTRGEWERLLKERDEAQERVSAMMQRKRDITRAIVAKLETRKK